MHRAPLARPQGRTRGRCARTRTLKDRLTRHWTSGSGPHRRCSSCRRRRRRWSRRRLVHRTRPSLRNNHPRTWRLHRRGRGSGGNRRSGGLRRRSRWHGRLRNRGRRGLSGGRRDCGWRGLRGRNCSRRSGRPLNRRWRRWNSKGRARSRCWNHQARCGRRSRGRLGSRCCGCSCHGGHRLGLCRWRNHCGTNGRWNGWSRRGRRLLLGADGVQHIARLGDMRQINLGLDFIPIRAAGARRFGGTSLRIAPALEIGTDLDCLMFFNGTGMRLLLGDAHQWQYIENRFTFDFQLPG